MAIPTNSFYNLSKKEQGIFQLKLAGISLGIILFFGLILFIIDKYLLLALPILLGVIITVIAPFFDVPSLIENGKLKYYSLFFLVEKAHKGIIKIHGSTLFDYYFVLNKEMTSKHRTKLVLLEYLKGLQNLVQNTNEDVIIQGTSYIVNEKTANKVGMKKVQINAIQVFILCFNYVNLMMSLSLVKKGLQFPKLKNIHTFQGSVSDIRTKEKYINQLIDKLERND